MVIRVTELQKISNVDQLTKLVSQFQAVTNFLQAKKELEHRRLYEQPTQEAEHRVSDASQGLPDTITW